MRKTMYLIDGSALYYRSYFAFVNNPLINSKGEDTSVTFGFLSALIRLIEDQKPDYLAVIFDTKEPTFRHQIYNEYKATREKIPDEMAAQYPRLIDTLKRLNFILMERPGYEADDIIGTLASRFAGPDLQVFIVSGDKDMAQLVTDHISLFNPGKSSQPVEILDAGGVFEKHGVNPGQVIDWLALMGDSSDNIPGIPGVGKVTAVNLLKEYGSLAGIYEHVDKITKNVIRENLKAFQSQTELSRRLATIDIHVPIDANLDSLRFKAWNLKTADMVLKELEFRRLFTRMQTIAQLKGNIQEFTRHDQERVKYRLVDNMEVLNQIIKTMSAQNIIVFDLETSSLDFLTAQIAGIALAWKEDEAWYIPIHHPDTALDQDKVLEKLRPVMENDHIKKVAQNIKFDALILKEHGIEVKGIYFDTMIAAYLINPGGQHKLDKLSEYYLNYEMIHIESLIGSGKKQITMTEVPALDAARYAAEDADVEFKLYKKFKQMIHDLQMDELLYELEMPLVAVLMQIEKNGVTLDFKLLSDLSVKLEKEILILEKKIYDEAGEEFNLNSPQQLGKILFEKIEVHKQIGLKRPQRTKTGQYSTSENILERYLQHPIIEDILNFRKLTKLKNTYIDAIPQLVSKKTGRVHTSFNQTVAATGRLSSSNPNLQNIPIRTEIGREIRRAFIPSNREWLILSADYSQIELRIMAHLSQDENMMNSFKNHLDIHASTAAAIFGVSIEKVNTDQRRKAKEINFGIIYGMSKFGLASRLGISHDEAEQFISEYMATYPGIDLFMKGAIAMARKLGYVETMMRRRRYLPEIQSDNIQIRQFAERNAINTPVQGSAADLIKKAMIDIYKYIIDEKIPARMLLQVHDELVFEVDRESAARFGEKVKHLMEDTWSLRIPIVVETGIGNNWLEAHD